jgi:hypothetical protein
LPQTRRIPNAVLSAGQAAAAGRLDGIWLLRFEDYCRTGIAVCGSGQGTGISMRTIVVLAVLLASSAALAQSNAPASGAAPMVGDRPLVQIKPKGDKAGGRPSVADRMKACLEIEDATKERLDCFDAIHPPKPTKAGAKSKPAKTAADCRLVKEEDERLACYNGFADKPAAAPRPAATPKAAAPKT